MPQKKDQVPRQYLPFPARWAGKLILKVLGWEAVGTLAGVPKCVAITQHTSNWDGVLGISYAFSIDIRARWLGKKELFRGPAGPILKLLGGIPVDRSKANNLVEAAVQHLKTHDVAAIALAPEGSRSKTEYWKSGFYRIAVEANVPIALGQVDYSRKQVGIGKILYPSGDIEADMEIIRAFYEDIQPKYPEDATEIRLKPDQASVTLKQKSA